jgi:tetratricopeptide (TPR) repeat protein
VLVVGEPGVGKTRLAAAVAAEATGRGFTVLHGRCDEGLAAPYQPVIEAFTPWLVGCPDAALPRMLGHRSDLVQLWPELASRLDLAPTPWVDDPEARRWRLFESVVALVRSIADERPLLLIVDDLQWAEPSTLLLLGHLARSAVPRTALLATARRGDSGKAPADLLGDVGTTRSIAIIEVGGLDDGEVGELVALSAGDTPPEDLAAQLCRHTDGNPFFLAALLTHLEDVAFVRSPTGVWVTAAELDAAGVPQGVRGVISRRLALLGPEGRRALDAAAVAGLEFDQRIIGGVLDFDLDDTVDALDAAIAAGLIREVDAGQFSFAHALVRHTVLDDLSRTRLARLHWRIAEQLERHHPSRLGEIADHYASGRQIGDDATVARTSLAAGDHALERVAFEEAAGHLRTALDALDRLPPDPELRYQLLAALGRALNALAELNDAHRLWLQAADIARLARDPKRMLAAVEGYAYGTRITTDVEQIRLLDDLLEVLGPSDSALRASALGWRAVQNLATVPSHEDVRMADQAVAMARRTGRANALNSALQSRLLIETHAPDAEAMLRDAQEIVAAPEHIGPMWSDRLFAMRQLPVALVRLGRRDDAERQLAIVVSEAEQSGLRISIQNALLFRSALATASGRFAEGKAVAAEAAQRAGSHTMIVELAYAAQIVNGRMEQGRLDAVIAGLGAALDSPEVELPGYRAMLAGALAEDARFDEALYELDRLGGAAPTSDTERLIGHTPMAIRYVSEVCRRLFDQERATKLLAHVTPWAGQILVSQWGLSIEGAADRAVGHLLSTLGRFDDADTAHAAAAELERAAGFPPLVARTQYWHARTLVDRDAPGDRERARALLDVIDVTDRLGMALLCRQALSSRDQVDARPIR